MHFRTHVKAEHRGKSGQDEYSDGMVEHDMHVGELLKLIDDLGVADNTHRAVFDRQRSALQHLAGCRHDAVPQRKELELGRRLSRSGFCPLARTFPAGTTLNGIVAHEDWLPTFAAIAGAPDIKEQLLKGGDASNGRTYKNHIDGYNQLDYLTGKAKDRRATNSGT